MRRFYAQMASRFRGREEPSERYFGIATVWHSVAAAFILYIKHTTMPGERETERERQTQRERERERE